MKPVISRLLWVTSPVLVVLAIQDGGQITLQLWPLLVSLGAALAWLILVVARPVKTKPKANDGQAHSIRAQLGWIDNPSDSP